MLSQAGQDTLVELLEGFPTLSDPHDRSLVIERLPNQIRRSLVVTGNPRAVLARLVKTCARYPDGLPALAEAVRYLEEGTLQMQAVDAFLAELASRRGEQDSAGHDAPLPASAVSPLPPSGALAPQPSPMVLGSKVPRQPSPAAKQPPVVNESLKEITNDVSHVDIPSPRSTKVTPTAQSGRPHWWLTAAALAIAAVVLGIVRVGQGSRDRDASRSVAASPKHDAQPVHPTDGSPLPSIALNDGRDDSKADAENSKHDVQLSRVGEVSPFAPTGVEAHRGSDKAKAKSSEDDIQLNPSKNKAPTGPARPARRQHGITRPPTRFRPALIALNGDRFRMGTPDNEASRNDDEGPQHWVTVPPLWMCRTEITQAQWTRLMGQNPSDCTYECGDELPVNMVSWLDVVDYMNRLSQREGLATCYKKSGRVVRWQRDCNGYRMPTEAEWEYAARAGSSTAYSFGSDAGQLDEYGWYKENAWKVDKRVRSVATRKPNGWGFYDMHGNVWEWVWDWHTPYPSKGEKRASPMDPSSREDEQTGALRVLRGGSVTDHAPSLRSGNRYTFEPTTRVKNLGARCARAAP
ncbi:SUMF1/EgtB/PvdO family nonheme iron enzyme [Haliangium sp.]|uniref:SUMF1/EgtB/PvdO family nonheme iron enzyme n=1 Tax=Haliangium sp. TaxID=2663208 RepID=UPI003D0EB15A